MKKILAAVLTAAMLTGTAQSAEILSGGSIPLINNLIGIGVMSLDFSSPGVNSEIALLIINNNSASFDVTLDFANSAEFQNAAGVPIAMTGLTVGPGGLGTLGTGPIPLVPAGSGNILAAVQGAGTWTWSPVDQTTATVNYSLSVKASWALFTGLAGLYTESITATITATL